MPAVTATHCYTQLQFRLCAGKRSNLAAVSMKKFLFRLLLFCFIPVPLLLFLDHAVEKGLGRSRYLYYADWNDLYSGAINADAIVLGTSRAYLHVSPAILDTALKLNTYNLGMDGASFDIQYNILKLYLQHNRKPRYIIQEVGYPTFVASDSVQYFHEFVAHLGDTAIRKLVKSHNASVGLADLYFPLYKYNTELPLAKEGLMSYTGHGSPAVKYKGYEARDYPWDSTFYLFKKNHPHGMVMPIDTTLVTLFNRYLAECADSGITVILFYAPTYYQSRPYILNYTQIHAMITGSAAAHSVPFLDYADDSINYHKEYFYNTQHLNRTGAELFSTKLAQDIKAVIKLRMSLQDTAMIH